MTSNYPFSAGTPEAEALKALSPEQRVAVLQATTVYDEAQTINESVDQVLSKPEDSAKESENGAQNYPIESLLQSTHPRARALYDFVSSSDKNKAWYLKNQDQIKLLDDGIEIQGLVFCLDNEKAEANRKDIWDFRGETLFTFDAAQRHAATQGKRVPTNQEWQKLIDFLPSNTSVKFFLDILKIPLAGYRDALGSTFFPRGVNAYLWSSSPYDAITAHSRYLNNGNDAVIRDYNNKPDGFSVRCVKD